MTFICTVAPDRPLDVLQTGDTYSVHELVGFDDQRDLAYWVSVVLAPLPGGDVELIFWLAERDGETGGEHLYWSGKDVAHFIPRGERARILYLVGEAVRTVVIMARPERIFRHTMDADPPEQALRKHFLIEAIIKMCGYKVTSAEVHGGHHSWWMERTVD